MQNSHLRRISALRVAQSLAYLLDMSSLTALLRLELYPHLEVLQRSLEIKSFEVSITDLMEQDVDGYDFSDGDAGVAFALFIAVGEEVFL